MCQVIDSKKMAFWNHQGLFTSCSGAFKYVVEGCHGKIRPHMQKIRRFQPLKSEDLLLYFVLHYRPQSNL